MLLALRFVLTFTALTLSVPSAARWLEARSANFIVSSTGSDAELRRYVTTLEDYDALLRIMTNVARPPAPNPLHIVLVRDDVELAAVKPMGRYVLGFYHASPEATLAIAIRGGGGLDAQSVILHEYAHHFMYQYAAAAYPRWYVEGFAEYFMTATFAPDKIEFGKASDNRARWLVNGFWLPIERLFSGSTKGLTADQDAMYYAEAWLTTHYLFRHPAENAKLTSYLIAIGRGDVPAVAFKSAFGITFPQFQTELFRYMSGGRPTFSRLTRSSAAKPVDISVRELPVSADALMLPATAMLLDNDEARGKAILAQVRTAAARYPNDDFARRQAARAEILYGDATAGTRLADALIAENASDADALYLRGLATLRSVKASGIRDPALLRGARMFFARAHKLDPDNVTDLLRYLEAAPDGKAAQSDNQLDVALAAHVLAPQIAEAGMIAAPLLIRRGRIAEARLLLGPIANNPHGGDATAAARTMLDALPADPVLTLNPAG